MTDAHAADDHATPLTPAERDDLIPTYITVRGELNELEQKNIATADRWAFSRRHVVTRDRFSEFASPNVRPCLAMGRKVPDH